MLEINCLASVNTALHFRVTKEVYVSWKLYLRFLFQSLINIMMQMCRYFCSSQFVTDILFDKHFIERFYRLRLLIITIWVFRNKDIDIKVYLDIDL